MSTKQRYVHRSKTCYQTLKHFDNVFATGGNNKVEAIISYQLAPCISSQLIYNEDQKPSINFDMLNFVHIQGKQSV